MSYSDSDDYVSRSRQSSPISIRSPQRYVSTHSSDSTSPSLHKHERYINQQYQSSIRSRSPQRYVSTHSSDSTSPSLHKHERYINQRYRSPSRYTESEYFSDQLIRSRSPQRYVSTHSSDSTSPSLHKHERWINRPRGRSGDSPPRLYQST